MTLKTAIKQRKVAEMRRITKERTVAEIADMLEEISTADRVLYFRLLKSEQQADIFAAIEPAYQEKLVKAFTDKEIASITDDLFADEIAGLIEEVPKELAERILRNTDKATRSDVNKLLRYADNQTGSMMTVDIVSVKQAMNVEDTIKLVKKMRDDADFSHYLWVTDNKNKLTGVITVEDLLFESKSSKIKTIIKPVISVQTTTDREDAAKVFADHDMSALPVVNSKGELIGAIHADDVIDTIHEVATEDMHRMAGIKGESHGNYLRTSAMKLFKSRVLWLMLLMISATLSQIVLDNFQSISNNLLANGIIWTTAIVAILPVISGAAGNASSQSSTTIIRALAMGDISPKDYRKVFWKELKVSTVMGLSLGVANFARLLIYYLAKQDFDDNHLMLSLAASLALWSVIVLAKLAGGMLPLLAKKLNLDPAIMAAPLLTTLIDALSTMIFFGISIGIMVMFL